MRSSSRKLNGKDNLRIWSGVRLSLVCQWILRKIVQILYFQWLTWFILSGFSLRFARFFVLISDFRKNLDVFCFVSGKCRKPSKINGLQQKTYEKEHKDSSLR